ncbi:MAG: hypothetical protein K2P59_10405 [Acetatifactor sp.]|nr:hypothetical protein [Acetatifactor sp.]
MNPDTKWIWKNGEHNENTWMCFVKKVRVEKIPQTAVAKIAVDSKYWLYINGSLAVFEGGVKRGPTRNSTYYDEIDIAGRLRAGENTIAVLVWYFGKNGFSHLSSGRGGLLFEADLNDEIISSDHFWRVMKHPAYVKPDDSDSPANFRLSESNIYFDGARDIGQWYSEDYDTSLWEHADVICNANEGAYGTLQKRIIPQFRDYGVRNYENSADFESYTTTEETTLKLKLPYNAQITPCLEISAERGKRISVRSDTYDDLLYDTKSVMSVYYTKDGKQQYECLGWLNGEYMYYTLPAGITIHKLQYRETGYDTEFAGSFECDDAFLNKLWEKSLRTLYITMRDTFMDCPDRERVQWWGDVNVEMQMMMYCLDRKALLLYQKGADSMAGWAADTGYILTVVPSGTEQFELPLQNLSGIWGFSYYYDYTGDISLMETVYPMSRKYLLDYKMNSDGLVEHRSGSWDWPDWGENADIAPMENAWYCMALESCKKMAALLIQNTDKAVPAENRAKETCFTEEALTSDIALYNERIESIRKHYDRMFLKDGYYYNETANRKPDDRANALAVLSGLAGQDLYDGILNLLQSTENASPYMEKYVLDAICEMGYTDEAVKRMKKRYREMVDYEYSTLWEYWDKGGTLNHAWSGGPLITMSKYIAGIRPLDTAYQTFEIKPRMGSLHFIKCKVPSIKGDIVLEIRKTAEQVSMSVKIPENTTAEVYLPLVNDKPPKSADHEFTPADGYAKYILPGGEYHLE